MSAVQTEALPPGWIAHAVHVDARRGLRWDDGHPAFFIRDDGGRELEIYDFAIVRELAEQLVAAIEVVKSQPDWTPTGPTDGD